MPIQSLLERKLQPQPKGAVTTTVRPVTNAPNLQLINGRLIAYDDNRENYIIKGYNLNDLVYSVVNLITNKCKVPKWGMFTVEDENAYKQLEAIRRKKDWTAKDFTSATELQHKALKPVKNKGKWDELLDHPNENQSFTKFVEMGVSYKLITGNNYIWGNVLPFGVNAGVPYELQILPAQWTAIYSTSTFPAKVVGYNVIIWPDMQYLPEQVLHEKMTNLQWDVQGIQLYGMSPLKAGLMRLKKNNSLTYAEAQMYQNQGVNGVLYMKNQVGNVSGEEVLPELQALKETMVNEWAGARNAGKMGLSGYEVGYIPIGLNAEEMGMIESGLVDLRMFCNLFGGVPSQLLNDPTNKHYNNYKEGEKALTSRCALPHLIELKDDLNWKGRKDWGMPKDQVCDFDITCFPELQADVKETAEWTEKVIAITPNEQRGLLGLPALPEEKMNEVWVQNMGRQPLSDYELNAVDNALNDPSGSDSPGDSEEDI